MNGQSNAASRFDTGGRKSGIFARRYDLPPREQRETPSFGLPIVRPLRTIEGRAELPPTGYTSLKQLFQATRTVTHGDKEHQNRPQLTEFFPRRLLVRSLRTDTEDHGPGQLHPRRWSRFSLLGNGGPLLVTGMHFTIPTQ